MMSRILWQNIVIIFVCSFFIASCSENVAVQGNVLHAGQTVSARNKFGSVRITYVDPYSRRFEWDGGSRVIRMRARPEPFQGRSGLYDPADSFGVNLQVRAVVEEGTVNLDSYDQLYAMLYEGSDILDWVYSPDGLVVGFGRNSTRDQINIDLYQLLVRGEKPHGLRGARPDLIRLTSGSVPLTK